MKNILAIGAHPDDVEFGCSGTLKKHIDNGDKVIVLVMSCSGVLDATTRKATRTKDASLREAKKAIEKELGAELIIAPFTDTAIPFDTKSVSYIEKIINENNIDTVYTHWAGDTHQDHINTLHSTLAASRLVSNVYCYEQVPLPRVCVNYPVANYYVDVSGEPMQTKIHCSLAHTSQVQKYSAGGIDIVHNIKVLAMYRGLQCNKQYAEAFVVLKSLQS
jgi:N-acetylglucosamine malate deacetylase 1